MPHELESPGASGRRRGNSRTNAEDQALDQIAKEVSDTFLYTNLQLTNKLMTLQIY